MNYYKKMYLELFNATENSIKMLINAQRKCEEIFALHEKNEANIVIIKSHTNNK